MLTEAEDRARNDMLAYIGRLEATVSRCRKMEDACKDLVNAVGALPAAQTHCDAELKKAYSQADAFFRDDWLKTSSGETDAQS